MKTDPIAATQFLLSQLRTKSTTIRPSPEVTLRLKVSHRWWLPLYLLGIEVFCRTFKTSPNPDRVFATVMAGTLVTFAPEESRP